MNNVIAAISLAMLLSACVNTNTMYDWGRYEETLFINYHELASKEKALREYIAFIDAGGSPDHPIAPGLFAEAGTFMLEKGDLANAIKYYQLEYEAWPESRPMLSVLIKNLGNQTHE